MRYLVLILGSPIVAVAMGKVWSGSYYRHFGRDVVFGLVFGVVVAIIVGLARSRGAERERQQRLREL